MFEQSARNVPVVILTVFYNDSFTFHWRVWDASEAQKDYIEDHKSIVIYSTLITFLLCGYFVEEFNHPVIFGDLSRFKAFRRLRIVYFSMIFTGVLSHSWFVSVLLWHHKDKETRCVLYVFDTPFKVLLAEVSLASFSRKFTPPKPYGKPYLNHMILTDLEQLVRGSTVRLCRMVRLRQWNRWIALFFTVVWRMLLALSSCSIPNFTLFFPAFAVFCKV